MKMGHQHVVADERSSLSVACGDTCGDTNDSYTCTISESIEKNTLHACSLVEKGSELVCYAALSLDVRAELCVCDFCPTFRY